MANLLFDNSLDAMRRVTREGSSFAPSRFAKDGWEVVRW